MYMYYADMSLTQHHGYSNYVILSYRFPPNNVMFHFFTVQTNHYQIHFKENRHYQLQRT